jgi:hypothetical protein
LGTRHSLRPLTFEGQTTRIKLAQTSGEIAKLWLRMRATQTHSSWPGLTRPSINLRKGSYSKKMDCRVKPGNDGLMAGAHARRDREAVTGNEAVSGKAVTQSMIHRTRVLTSTDPDAISTAPGPSGLLALNWKSDDWIDPIERWAR